MARIFTPRDRYGKSQYEELVNWLWWMPKHRNYPNLGMNGYPNWGWKIHVTATPRLAQSVANRVLPALIRAEAVHKLQPSSEDVRDWKTGNRDCGKFIVAYPRSRENLDYLVMEIEDRLENLNAGQLLELSGAMKPVHDTRIGSLDCVFIRKGGFDTDDTPIIWGGKKMTVGWDRSWDLGDYSNDSSPFGVYVTNIMNRQRGKRG